MPLDKEHCDNTMRMYGVTGTDIHYYMDSPSKEFGPLHQRLRHDLETVKYIGKTFRKKYGKNLAEDIAQLHIKNDKKKKFNFITIEEENIITETLTKNPKIKHRDLNDILFKKTEKTISYKTFSRRCEKLGIKRLVGGASRKVIYKEQTCPECGSHEITSQGRRWNCYDCGRNFIKSPRQLKSQMKKTGGKITPTFFPEQICPKCGSHKIASWSENWKCYDCGRSFKKIYIGTTIKRPKNPCPKCNSTNIRSRGACWSCGKCGKSWTKILVKHDEIKCAHCEKLFLPFSSKQKFCSGECNNRYYSLKRKLKRLMKKSALFGLYDLES